MPPLASKAHYVTSKMNASMAPGEILSEQAETAFLASMGMTPDEAKLGVAQYNSFVQSQAREDISHACQAYY